jgi:hypothetical protein
LNTSLNKDDLSSPKENHIKWKFHTFHPKSIPVGLIKEKKHTFPPGKIIASAESEGTEHISMSDL